MASSQPQDKSTNRREVAWTAAKLAVRSYARDPSGRNADEVQRAWVRVRSVMAESVRLRNYRQSQRPQGGEPRI